ncbi:MAG: hypothetical protein IPG20_10650 [Gammaproteobacteria bacterium]|nr:hypothetical protein [Gammaproteobacteria bacterium]
MSTLATRLVGAGLQLKTEFTANRRLATLVLIVPAILIAYLALLTGDRVTAAMADSAPLERRAARLDALAGSGDWQARIDAGRHQLEYWEAQAWHARSAELAAADLQTALRQITAEHLAWNRMKFSPAEPIPGIDGWRIKAEINGKLKEDGVMGMVQAIAEHQPRILIEQLSVSLQRGQTLRLQLAVVVIREEQAP